MLPIFPRPLNFSKRGVLFYFLVFMFVFFLAVGGCGFMSAQEEHDIPGEERETEDSNTESAEQEVVPEETEEERRLREKKEAEQVQKEREELEEQRREELGSLYVPLPPLDWERDNPPVKARGLYLTGNSVGLESRYNSILEMVETTELNSLVIDVKNDHGIMSYRSEIEAVEAVGANQSIPIKDMKSVLEELDERDIYTIARVVVFKDPHLAEERPDWSIQKNEGGLWRDRKGVAWVDPYEKKIWDYNIAIAREAALKGFREIQFDYVRFPENARDLDRDAYYPAQNELEKDELIRDFLIYADEELAEYDVYLSADVFGVISTSWGDSDRIGQTWEKIAAHVDYICPMVYPSHYGPGYFGFEVPDAKPRGTVWNALKDSLKRNAPLEEPAIIRPWLQSFTASWIRGNIGYGPTEIRQQIDAAVELGIDEYLLWNANNRYQPEALLSEEEANRLVEEQSRLRTEEDRDALGRTPVETVEIFVNALRTGDWQEALVVHIKDADLNYQNYSEWKELWNVKPVSVEIERPDIQEEHYEGTPFKINLEVHMGVNEFHFELAEEKWEMRLDNHIWRLAPSAEFLKILTMPQKELERLREESARVESGDYPSHLVYP